jgi:methionine aminopeptidase
MNNMAVRAVVDPIVEAISTHERACLIADLLLRSLQIANEAGNSLEELRSIADATFEAIMQEYAAGAVISGLLPSTVDGVNAVAAHLAVERYSAHLRRGGRVITA